MPRHPGSPGRPRLSATERSAQVLDAAITAFATAGYAGTRTDEIARMAGVSQPYVIRLFGTKQQLFLAAFDRACDRIAELFITAGGDDPSLDALADGYHDFLAERDLLALLLHGFAASSDPTIGEVVRERFGVIYQLIRDLTGASQRETREFMASGMLLSVMAAMRVVGPQAVPIRWATEILDDFDAESDERHKRPLR